MSATEAAPTFREEDISRRAQELYEERERLTREDWYSAEKSLLSWMNSAQDGRRISHETIAETAYKFWESRRGAMGTAEDDWHRAIASLRRSERQAA
jgi:hypothetical protein